MWYTWEHIVTVGFFVSVLYSLTLFSSTFSYYSQFFASLFWIIWQCSKKRKLCKLITAETIDGGKLREAATQKDDHRVLVQILGKDCVAIEVKYHLKCYKSYTSFLTRPFGCGSTLQKDKVTKYKTSFESFAVLLRRLSTSATSFICQDLRKNLLEQFEKLRTKMLVTTEPIA